MRYFFFKVLSPKPSLASGGGGVGNVWVLSRVRVIRVEAATSYMTCRV